MDELLGEVAEVAFASVPERVVHHLLELAVPGPGGGLVAPVTQRQLADAAGTVREVVARVLRDLRADGLVTPAGDGVRLLDPPGLHDRAWRPLRVT